MKQRIQKAKHELERYRLCLITNETASLRGLQECYRQLALAAVEATSDSERDVIKLTITAIDETVGY